MCNKLMQQTNESAVLSEWGSVRGKASPLAPPRSDRSSNMGLQQPHTPLNGRELRRRDAADGQRARVDTLPSRQASQPRPAAAPLAAPAARATRSSSPTTGTPAHRLPSGSASQVRLDHAAQRAVVQRLHQLARQEALQGGGDKER